MAGAKRIRFVMPALALALVASAWLVPEPKPPVVDGGKRSVAVAQTTWACPTQAGWRVWAGQVAKAETAEATLIAKASAQVPQLADAQVWRSAVPGAGALKLHSEGESAGAAGFVSGPGNGTQAKGSVLASCPAIIDEAWFVGLADSGRKNATVTLVNLGQERAVADLKWWGAVGPIESSDTTGLVIEGQSMKVVSVEAVAAGEPVVAVSVSRRRGALTAIATDAGPTGIEVVSPTANLAKSQLLVGPAIDTTGRLAVVNPATSTAHVSVEVRGPKGSFAAQGLEDIAVEPESVRVISVPAQVELQNSALHVTSDLAVAASLTVATTSDTASVVPATKLTGPAIVPAFVAKQPVTLLATAGDSAASIEVEEFSASMESLSVTSVSIAAGASQPVGKPKSEMAAYRVIRPAKDSQVWLGAAWRDKGRIASAVVRPAPLTVVVPGVSVR